MSIVRSKDTKDPNWKQPPNQALRNGNWAASAAMGRRYDREIQRELERMPKRWKR